MDAITEMGREKVFPRDSHGCVRTAWSTGLHLELRHKPNERNVPIALGLIRPERGRDAEQLWNELMSKATEDLQGGARVRELSK